jgi:hypothetical protein
VSAAATAAIVAATAAVRVGGAKADGRELAGDALVIAGIVIVASVVIWIWCNRS